MADQTLQEAVDAALTDEASKPKSSSLGGMSVTNRDPRALIELAKYAKKTTGHPFGFSMRKIIPPEH